MKPYDFIIRFKSDGVDQLANTVKGKLSSAMGDIKTAAAGYLSFQFVKQQIEATKDYALRIKDLSEQFGISTTRLQEMEYAAKMSGMTIEDVIQSYVRFQLAREAALSGKAGNSDQKNFDMLGLTSSKLASMSPEEAWNAAGSAMSKLGDNANAARMSVDLFGRSGIRFANALKGGFMDAADSASKLGVVIGDDVIQKMDLLDKKMALIGLRARRWTANTLSGGMDAADSVFPTASGIAGGFMAFMKTAVQPKLWGSMFDNIAEGYHGTKTQAENDITDAQLEIARQYAIVADAERKLKKKKMGGNENDLSNITNSASSGGADALERMGLYRGGSGVSQTSLMQQQLHKLESIRQESAKLNTNLMGI